MRGPQSRATAWDRNAYRNQEGLDQEIPEVQLLTVELDKADDWIVDLLAIGVV